jgi:hypothetical protein
MASGAVKAAIKDQTAARAGHHATGPVAHDRDPPERHYRRTKIERRSYGDPSTFF